jgi:hypothetical protein
MQKHHDSETELTPLQIQDIAERAEVETPIMSYKVTGSRVELHLLGGAIATVEAHWLAWASAAEPLTPANGPDGRLKEMTYDQLYQLAKRLAIRGRSNLDKPGLIEAIQAKASGEGL